MSESFSDATPVSDQVAGEGVTPGEQVAGTGDQQQESDVSSSPSLSPSEYLERREKEMQADYTRKTQQVADQRREIEAVREQAESWERLQSDPEFQRAALERLGYEVPADGDDHAEAVDQGEQAFVDPRVDQLLELEQERQVQAVAQEVGSHIDELAAQAGVELTDKQRYYLFRDAVDQGEPAPARTEQVFNDFVDDVRSQRSAWEQRLVRSKQGAPYVSPGGEQGSPSFNINDRDARIARMAAVIDANREQ